MSDARLVPDMPEGTYHAHPALSASGARKLLPPSCPAIFDWERRNPPESKPHFDFGRAAHAAVLGIGGEVVVVDAESWRTKAAQEAQERAWAEGRTPLLAAEKAQINAMADALAAHPIASALLDPDRGLPEQSIFWHDDRHDIDRRSRLDWLPDTDGGRLIVADYKTTVSAEPGAIAKSVANYGYHQQAAFYVDAVRALGLAEDVYFLFVFQAKTAPFLITVVELDGTALRIGRGMNDQAMSVFAECSATGEWPGYSDDIELVSLPSWATYSYQELPA